MNLINEQCLLLNQFLDSFKIIEHNEDETVLSTNFNTYLIRNIQIEHVQDKQRKQKLAQITQTLYQHQQFNCKNILSLLDFQIISRPNKPSTSIRVVYQYGQRSLIKQIQNRKQSSQYFEQDALWGLIYSLVTPLIYLQNKNVIYGVIDASRIFLDKNIMILDPSSTGIDPYEIYPERLYSPEILARVNQVQQVDMFKSDVFIMGLLLLQSSLLKIDIFQYDETLINQCLEQVKQLYSEQFVEILSRMLSFDPNERPIFQQILKSLTDMFEISTFGSDLLEPFKPDQQNLQNEPCLVNQNFELEIVDILDVRQQDQSSITDYAKACSKYLFSSNLNESFITTISISPSFMFQPVQQPKKGQKSKIKEKFIDEQQNRNLLSFLKGKPIPQAKKSSIKYGKENIGPSIRPLLPAFHDKSQFFKY